MMDMNNRPPPAGRDQDEGFVTERRFRLRRLNVRRRFERAGSDRRMSERRGSSPRGRCTASWPF